MFMNTEQGYLLLVEDDPDILVLLDTTLKFKDYRVITAQNGRDALEVVQKERPKIVIADIMMPHLDGYGLVHRLRINPETRLIPVVFITATYVALEDREFALKIGVSRILKKPVDFEMFLQTIEDILNESTRVSVVEFDEYKYYDGYRELLEAKLDQKTRQIAREEHLLANTSTGNDRDIQDSLRHAVRDHEEIKLLLDEIHKQMERIGREG